MHRNLASFCSSHVALLLLLAGLFAAPALAGTQDFTLVNQTGEEIYSLYISETNNEDWEEDVLGDRVLPNGSRIDINFRGKAACMWDMLITDDEENEVEWTAINLCEASVVVLHCDSSHCWADWE